MFIRSLDVGLCPPHYCPSNICTYKVLLIPRSSIIVHLPTFLRSIFFEILKDTILLLSMRKPTVVAAQALLVILPLVLGDTTKVASLCTTYFAQNSPNPVPTSTFGLTVTSRTFVKTTSTPQQIITPAPTTKTYSTTWTNTVTVTLPQATDTYTETDTATQTCERRSTDFPRHSAFT